MGDNLFISVIVAVKNEEQNIINLLKCLDNQCYNLKFFEVILADDDSTDSTPSLIKNYISANNLTNFHYIYVSPDSYPGIVGKKKALTYGVYSSRGEVLAFTDADCQPKPDWLSDINIAFINHADFYTGYSPLVFKENNLLNQIKNLERTSIFAVSAGSFGLNIPLTCTARNMAYTRSLWNRAMGYKGIEHLYSGDDDLMLLKLRNEINKYHFSFFENAFVPSYYDKDIFSQIYDETRRTSKYIYYPWYVKLILGTVFTFYLLLVYQLFLSLFTFSLTNTLMVIIIHKVLCDFALLAIFYTKLGKSIPIIEFLIAELLHIPYFKFFAFKGTLGRKKKKNT
jgi:glycosyltransferase involved in cell wall biosynthesis